MSRWLLSLVAFCGLAVPLFAQKSPEETVKSMTVADGLQVELFAAEPMVINPTSIDVDHLGRVWVCEAVNYRRVGFKRPILREEGDRIVILTDKDGDGKADDSSVFYQGKDVYGPLGIAVAATPTGKSFAYKVFVCQSPDILLFEDKDGDGKADGPPKKFLTNFGGFDHDHGVHGINIGPDGKLYFTVGDSGVNGLQSADGKGRKYFKGEKDCQAGTVWRCDFDGNNLELIAHNFRNNYECCVNSFGEIWLSDNDDDGNQQTRICHVMPGGNYGYYPRGPGQTHWHEEQPGIVHKTMRTGFGSPTGICFYEGTLLPKRFHGQLLHTDAGPRELRAFHIKPKGAGYECEKENLVTSTDNWYRLSDVCVAPDGSVMLADWYDPGVGGHGMGDWKMGRIYRVTPKGHKGYKVPEVRADTNDGIFAALLSPCQATRTIALGSLESRSWVNAQKSLSAALATQNQVGMSDLARVRWWLDRAPEGKRVKLPAPAEMGEIMKANSQLHQEVRRLNRPHRDIKDLQTQSTRIFIERDSATVLLSERNFANPLKVNGSISEFREVLIGMRNMSEKAGMSSMGAYSFTESFYSLAKHYDGQDIFYRAALNIACGTDPKRREAILADFDKHFPEWNDKVADLVWELRPASVLPRLGKLLEDAKLTAAQKGRIVDILAASDDAAAGKTMFAVLKSDAAPEVKARAIDSLKLFLPTKWKALQGEKELNAALDDLLKKKETQIVGLQLVAAVGATDRVETVIRIADGNGGALDHADPTQNEAVRTLGKLKTATSVGYLSSQALSVTVNPTPTLRVATAITGLGGMISGQPKDDIGAKAMAALQRLVTENGHATPRQKLAVEVLAGTRPGTAWLLDQHEKGKLEMHLVADAGRLLRNSPFAGERNKALLLFPAPGKLDPKKLPSPAVLAKRNGDVKRGETVFKASLKSESQCMRCHMLRGVGGNIGPDLSMIGKKGSKENLYESLLLPSKAIADQFVQWKVNTLDEKSITGLLVEESATNITLRDANGKDHTFATKDLDGPKQKSLVSIMPDNLVAALTEDELVDMVEYLMTLKTASLTPEKWSVIGPFRRPGGNEGLAKEFGPEKAAFDAKATFPEWNGPSSGPKAKDLNWRTINTDAKGYVDLAAFYGDAGKESVSYLYRAFDSPAEMDAELLIGPDDGCVVYVNGKEVLREIHMRAAAPEQFRVKVKLKAGKNAVLIKIANGDNPHGLYFALTSEQELKLVK